MEVLGIDPGYERMGYAVCARAGTAELQLVEAGVIRSPAHQLFSARLLELSAGLQELLARFKVTEAAIEQLFFAPHWQGAVKVAAARGVALLELARAQLPIFEYAPTAVKRAVTGNGSSSKAVVQTMVMRVCGLTEPIKEDNAADAAALAVTQLLQRTQAPQLQQLAGMYQT